MFRLAIIYVLIAFSLLFTTAIASQLPAPLEQALSEAEAQSTLRVSFTQSFEWPGYDAVIERFNAQTGDWTLLSGNPEALPPIGRKKLRNYKRIESAAGGLVYADYRRSFKEVSLVEETADTYVYAFMAGGDAAKMDANAKEKVKTRAIISKHNGAMIYYGIEALTGFKPNPVSRLDEFIFKQSFIKISENHPPVMSKVYWKAIGKRAFTKLNEEFTILYSDFQIIE